MFNSVIDKLQSTDPSAKNISLGFDGYVDEIIQAVASRKSVEDYTSIPTITEFGDRILKAAGKSTNIELYTNTMKLGGNGPILGNSVASLGTPVFYVGALGTPKINDVFSGLHKNFKYISIENPGHTMAVEFDDGKIMFGRLAMKDLTWDNIIDKCSEEELFKFFCDTDLIGMVNWTQTPFMDDIWDQLINTYLPQKITNEAKKPYLFVDLADPQKRSSDDIINMMKRLGKFSSFYNVILGLNEKEAYEMAKTFNINYRGDDRTSLEKLSEDIRAVENIYCCVIHPVKFAVCASQGETFYAEGPFTPNPLISTGAGDHFNAGFCYGIINGMDFDQALLTGVANSGFYVRTAKSATKEELTGFLNEWKNNRI